MTDHAQLKTLAHECLERECDFADVSPNFGSTSGDKLMRAYIAETNPVAVLALIESVGEGKKYYESYIEAMKLDVQSLMEMSAGLLAANSHGGWIDELRKDSERYQWWVETMTHPDSMGILSKHFRHLPHDTIPSKEQFNEVVDAAIAAQKVSA